MDVKTKATLRHDSEDICAPALPYPRSWMLPGMISEESVYFPDERKVYRPPEISILLRNGCLDHFIEPHSRTVENPSMPPGPNVSSLYEGTRCADGVNTIFEEMSEIDKCVKALDDIEYAPNAYVLITTIKKCHCGVVKKAAKITRCKRKGVDAQWEVTGKFYAVKILAWERINAYRAGGSQEDCIQESDALQFFRRLDTIGGFGHGQNSTVRQVDLLYDNENLYHILPFFDECELYDRIPFQSNQGRRSAAIFPEERAKHFIRCVIEGLEWLHNIAGVWHRDIKPSNIVCHKSTCGAETINCFIIDFCPSLRVRHGNFPHRPLKTRLRNPFLVGTYSYLSPEVLISQEQGKEVCLNGFACDMWSVGIILYAMLTGTLPCESASAENIRFQYLRDSFDKLLLHDTRTRIEMGVEQISPQLRDFLHKLLCIDADQRLTSREALGHPWLQSIPLPNSDDHYAKHINVLDDLMRFD